MPTKNGRSRRLPIGNVRHKKIRVHPRPSVVKNSLSVTGIAHWERRFGYLGSALVCQVTRIELNGHVGYVRENLRNCSGLHVSSSHRLGITGGVIRGKVRPGNIPKTANQILELTAPDEAWSAISEAVRQADRLKRPVLRTKQWTLRIAQALYYKPQRLRVSALK